MKSVKGFITLVINFEEIKFYFKVKNCKLEISFKVNKTLFSILESVETVVNIGETTLSVTSSVTGVELIAVPKSTGIAWALSLNTKVLHKIKFNKSNKYENNMEKINKLLNLLVNYTEKNYKIFFLVKNEQETPWSAFNKYVDKKKWIFFKTQN